MSNEPPAPDPYASYLRQAEDLFARGEVVKAGQIWQAILKQQPAHAVARERLIALKQHLLALQSTQTETAAAPLPVGPPRPPEPAVDLERMVREGCTLYDMGQVSDALQKWEQVLALDAGHALARSYAEGARRELGLPPLQAASAAPSPGQDAAITEDVDHLLREAVQLYDMGLTEEAISKWERVLVLEPHRTEVAGYLRQALQEVTQAAPAAPPPPAPTPAASAPPPTAPETEGLELKLRQADHLLHLQRYEEAAFTYQQALRMAPGHPRALEGLDRSRRPAAPPPAAMRAPEPLGRIEMADEDATLIVEPQAVEPPATLLKAAPAPREGLALPEQLQAASRHLPWLKDPKVAATLSGAVLVLVAGSFALHAYRKEQALKEAVKAARAAAVAPVLQQAQAPDLAETAPDIREEAEAALGSDPLLAYLRAQALVTQFPSDAAGPQLLERARAGLGGGAVGASLPEFQKHVQDGDLETAAKVMDALLRAQPEDGGLRTRAARLQRALCAAHAAQGKWTAAAEDLRRGRALFPADKSWQVRLRLLDRVKALPKAQQEAWISMLG